MQSSLDRAESAGTERTKVVRWLRPISKARQPLPEFGQPRRRPRFHVAEALPTQRPKAGTGASHFAVIRRSSGPARFMLT